MKCFIAAPGMNPLAKAQLKSSSVLTIPPSSLEAALQPLRSLATGEAEQLLGVLSLLQLLRVKPAAITADKMIFSIDEQGGFHY